MKKKLLLFLGIWLFFFTTKVEAQVNFEHKYTITNPGQQLVFLTNLGNNNYKYVINDYFHERFSLYNLDHTPFLLNVQLPISTDSGTLYKIGYITSTLFDCNESNIEYAIMSQSPYADRKFYIYRTDGTLVFSKDSCTIPYCYGCNVGSVETNGIVNTPDGAKLFLFNPNYEVFIYNLCGELPESIVEIDQSQSFVSVIPNPAIQEIKFQINLPSNLEDYYLTIYNNSFQLIKNTGKISDQSILIDCHNYSAGTYNYVLQSKNKVFQTGKFVIIK